jgi:hypothetical protein
VDHSLRSLIRRTAWSGALGQHERRPAAGGEDVLGEVPLVDVVPDPQAVSTASPSVSDAYRWKYDSGRLNASPAAAGTG